MLFLRVFRPFPVRQPSGNVRELRSGADEAGGPVRTPGPAHYRADDPASDGTLLGIAPVGPPDYKPIPICPTASELVAELRRRLAQRPRSYGFVPWGCCQDCGQAGTVIRWPRRKRKDAPLTDEDLVVTTHAVLSGAEPVALAARMYSGEFLMVNRDTSTAEPTVTRFGHLVEDDQALEALRTLRRGDLFVRRPGQEWIRHLFYSDQDFDELMDSLSA